MQVFTVQSKGNFVRKLLTNDFSVEALPHHPYHSCINIPLINIKLLGKLPKFHSFSLYAILKKKFPCRQYQRGELNRTGPGEMNRPVSLTEEEAQQASILQKKAGFNILVSDMIALDRSLPDRRKPE